MKRSITAAWVAIATVFAVLVGSHSAQAAIVGDASYVLSQATDWAVSLDVTPDGRYVFVTNYTAGSVARFDTTDSTVTNTSLCAHPYGVSIAPDGTTAAIACSGSNALVYVNVNTLTVQQTFGGNTPIAAAFNHAGTKIYSASETDDTFRAVDNSNRFSVSTVAITGTGWQGPFYIAVSPDDTKAYVSNIVGNTVTEIALDTLTVTRTFTGFNAPLGLAVTADGSGLWVASSSASANDVKYVDLNSGAVTHTVTVGQGPREIALSPDGSQLAVANGAASTISLIDTDTFAVTATQAVGNPGTSSNGGISAPWGIKYSPDGSKLYVANEYNGSLQAFTLDPALAAETQNAAGGGVLEKLANTGAPNWWPLGALGLLLASAGALTVLSLRRRAL